MNNSTPYAHLFSGINAPEYAIQQLNEEGDYPLQCVYTSEISPNAIKVQKDNFPSIPCFGDVSTVVERPNKPPVDLVIAGSPCQSFSCAGDRSGLEGKSGLLKEFWRFLQKEQPRAFIWENVSSVVATPRSKPYKQRQWKRILSAFASGGYFNPNIAVTESLPNDVLAREGGLAKQTDDGYHLAWVELDAIWSSPQSRKRIYMIGFKDIQAWRIFDALLYERKSLKNHFSSPTTPLEKACEGYPPSMDFSTHLQSPEEFKPLTRADFRRIIDKNEGRGGEHDIIVEMAKEILSSENLTADASKYVYQMGECFSLVFDKTKGTLPAPSHWKLTRNERLTTPCLMVGASEDGGRGNNASKPLGLLYVKNGLVKGRFVTPEETEALMGFPRGWTKAAGKGGSRRRLVGGSMSVDCIKAVIRAYYALSKKSSPLKH